MTQSGGAKNTIFLATLYNFQESVRAISLPAPPPPRSLYNICLHSAWEEKENYISLIVASKASTLLLLIREF